MKYAIRNPALSERKLALSLAEGPKGQKTAKSGQNLHLNYVLARQPTYFTIVENPLQIAPILQNKPNFQNGKMNIALYPETNYERKGLYSCRKNKAKQTQFKLEAQRRSLRVSFLESSNQGANLAKMGHYE